MAEAINALFGGPMTDLAVDVPTDAEKAETYASIRPFIEGLCADENLSALALLDLVTGVLHNAFPTFFWTGFYRRVGAEMLEVGPSQGTLGCSHIAFGRGVCGTVAATEKTRIVDDVHAEPNHIACDDASRSEIVVPVLIEGRLAAVLDVDSALPSAFSTVDQTELEAICTDIGKALSRKDLSGIIRLV